MAVKKQQLFTFKTFWLFTMRHVWICFIINIFAISCKITISVFCYLFTLFVYIASHLNSVDNKHFCNKWFLAKWKFLSFFDDKRMVIPDCRFLCYLCKDITRSSPRLLKNSTVLKSAVCVQGYARDTISTQEDK